jgi:cysteine dioxygenase
MECCDLVMNNLEELVSELQKVIPSATNISGLTKLVGSYKGEDWNNFIHFDKLKYNREYVHCSAEFDLLVISWTHGQMAKPHDHPEKGCIMRVLSGSLIENLYRNDGDKLKHISKSIHEVGQVCYIDDDRGFHSISNESSNTGAVSLHLYSPGNYSPNYLLD